MAKLDTLVDQMTVPARRSSRSRTRRHEEMAAKLRPDQQASCTRSLAERYGGRLGARRGQQRRRVRHNNGLTVMGARLLGDVVSSAGRPALVDRGPMWGRAAVPCRQGDGLRRGRTAVARECSAATPAEIRQGRGR
jgi:hypothetical protein